LFSFFVMGGLNFGSKTKCFGAVFHGIFSFLSVLGS